MALPNTVRVSRINPRWMIGLCLLLVAGLAVAFQAAWLPTAQNIVARWSGRGAGPEASPSAAHDDHGHEHGHGSHDAGDALELSEQARKNIGLKSGPIELQDFSRTISVPGVVVERPGRSIVEITAPMTGLVTRIGVIQGEAVTAGQFLFELRLTHEDLVQAQSEFLKTTEELDVMAREVKRLDEATASGAVAGKALLERKYEQQKQQAALRAQHQALLLHGLSEEQIREIQVNRTLLKHLKVAVPTEEEMSGASDAVVYQVQQLKVEKGQQVLAGDTLAVLANHAELFIEGRAFEKDVPLIQRAVEQDASLTAVLESAGQNQEKLPTLKILYLAGSVDLESRSSHFYVTLPNEQLRDQKVNGHRFISWLFKPGQRMQVLVPVEEWKNRIVLPAEAVAQDGVETYVFQINGKRFQRRPVHVEYRDPYSVVIANDGSVFPGDTVALSAAQQMLLSLKNKAGGGIDPHAGHNH